jgi:hypothetical protein
MNHNASEGQPAGGLPLPRSHLMRPSVLLASIALIGAGVAIAAQPSRPPARPEAPAANPPSAPPIVRPPAAPKTPAEPIGAPDPNAKEPPERRLMAETVGDYDVKISVFLEPGGEPETLNAFATRKLVLGGMFLVEQLEGRDEKLPYGSMATFGFNPDTHAGPRFEIVRYSTLAPCAMPEIGKWDPDRQVLSSTGEHEVSGMAARTRVIEQHEGPDKFTIEVHSAFEGYSTEFVGLKIPEFKTMVLEYRRRKP